MSPRAFGRLLREVPPHGLLSMGDQLVMYHPPHQALFLDQTVSDALGGEGWGVRRQAAFEASHALLASLSSELGVHAAQGKLELAAELFAALGHGRLVFDVAAEGGTVVGENLYFGAGFSDRYGNRIKNRRPLDAFAAGYASAAASLAFPSDWASFEAEETACTGRGDEVCRFVLTRRPERARFGAIVTRAAASRTVVTGSSHAERQTSGQSERASDTARGLLSALTADPSGAMTAFGLRIALVPVMYTGQITFDTMHLVERRTPDLVPVYTALVREAAHAGAFHLLGGVLASSEWLTEHGLPAREPEPRLHQLLGIARAFGWGRPTVEKFVPGRTLVLRCAVTAESAYHVTRHGKTTRPRLASLQGLALALVQLVHRVDFRAERPLTTGSYDELFRSGSRFEVEETRSPLGGDDVCEVTVEAIP